ncbi:MAG: hypothetical protein K1X57_08480, partial [Gemmataceae bacterium]|nr:hypothetical protein [Gemmataceae bacterium]
LGNLVSLTQGDDVANTLQIDATLGGVIDLHSLVSINDPNVGDTRGRSVRVTAQDPGSVVDLSGLTTFTDRDPNYADYYGIYEGRSALLASNSGKITVPALATASNVDVRFDAVSTFALPQLKSANGLSVTIASGAQSLPALTDAANTAFIVSAGSLAVPALTVAPSSQWVNSGGSVSAPLLANIDAASFIVSGGSTLSFPAAVSYSLQPLGVGGRRSFLVSGTGSKLDLGNLVSLTQGDDVANTLQIDATLGGVIDLHSLVSINDPNVGDTRGRSVRVTAQDPGSVVDLSGLTTFTDRDPNYADYYGIYEGRSALLASNSGKITVPALATASNVDVRFDAVSTFALPQLKSANALLFTLVGGVHALPALADASGSSWVVSGGTVALPVLSNIDGCNVTVTGGASLSFPAAVSYSLQPLGVGGRRSFLVSGTGSKLDLGNLVSLTQGDDVANTLQIDATLGGVIDLHSLVSINDPNVGDTRGRSVRVTAQDPGSVVDLSGLTTFTDRDPNYADYYGIYEGRSALLASNSGKITLFNGGSAVQNCDVNVDATSQFVGRLKLGHSANLAGAGTVVGDVVNAGGAVYPGGINSVGSLTITGNFTQTAGTLGIELANSSAFDRLLVGKSTTLGGELNITRLGGFDPVTGELFPVVVGSNPTGTFSSVLGGTFGGKSFVVEYQPTGARLRVSDQLIVVSPTSGLVTTEAGGQAFFNVSLTQAPSSSVTMQFTSSNTSEGTPSPSTIVFTPADWAVPRVVTVTGVFDFVVDGDVPYTIITSPAVSADPSFNNQNPPDVSVTNKSVDVAGVVITPTTGLVTTEAGGSATFTVRLNSAPAASVSFSLATSDATEGSTPTTSLTFTQSDWFQPQTVTITGIDDFLDDGDMAYSIVTSPVVSVDPFYNGLNPADISVVNVDNDTKGIAITPTFNIVTSEGGQSAQFAVVLTSQPTAPVSLGLNSSNIQEGNVSSTLLTFTPGNWNIPQVVTVSGVEDAVIDGNRSYLIVSSPAVSADLAYQGYNPPDVACLNLDNDSVAPYAPVTVSGVTIGDGSAQRSTVRKITVTFSQLVSLPVSPVSAFSLQRQSDGQAVTLQAAIDNSGAGTVVQLTFTGGLSEFGSLVDGRYTLTVHAANLGGGGGQLDGNGDGNAGDDYVLVGTPANGLFRLFGDADGNGTVNSTDFLAFRLAFLSNNAAFDFNNNGTVDSSDFLQFRLRFLQVI